MNQYYFYKLIVAYDGTDYHGWQQQDNYPTIVAALRKSYTIVFQQEVGIVGASRTDGGVHALHQVVRIRTTIDIEPALLRRVWNGRLPSDITIRSVERAGHRFHPQANVAQKTYWYHISPSRPLPFVARYVTHYRFPFDEQKLNAALQLFVGQHDFRSFCTGDEQESTVRKVDSITVTYLARYKIYRVEFRAERFLRYMIRRMIGAALHAAAHPEISLQDVQRVFKQCNPLHLFPTAPAQGLVLRKIKYTRE